MQRWPGGEEANPLWALPIPNENGAGDDILPSIVDAADDADRSLRYFSNDSEVPRYRKYSGETSCFDNPGFIIAQERHMPRRACKTILSARRRCALAQRLVAFRQIQGGERHLLDAGMCQDHRRLLSSAPGLWGRAVAQAEITFPGDKVERMRVLCGFVQMLRD